MAELQIGPGHADVTDLYDWLAGALAAAPLPEELRYRVHVVAEEVVTNVAKHAFPPGKVQVFTVQVSSLPDAVVLQVADTGQPFNPVLAAQPPRTETLADIEPGGWGIGLIRQSCPDISYDRQAGENRLTLRFPLNTA